MSFSSRLNFNLFKINYSHCLNLFKTQRRYLNLQEYQSKELLKKNNIYVQKFFLIDKHTDLSIFDDPCNEYEEYVVKAQILAGGRGKGYFADGYIFQSGVVITKSKEKAKKSAFGMLGHRLVTKQTGPEGVVVNKVMVAKSVPITQEAYLSIFMDPSIGGPVFVACPLGGMDIEEIAAEKPELILKEPIDIEEGITHEQVSDIIDWIQFNEFASLDAFDIIKRLYEFFIKYDAIQIEINPFAQVSMSHKEIFGLETTDELNEQEKLAKQYGLSYIPMDGNIACMVNGAGLAMATMDIIKLHGGLPANFLGFSFNLKNYFLKLDVGGSATVEQVCNAFKIVASDPKIKAIFVNIFAGILRCDIVAEGVITACNELKIDIPVVLRLKGTKVDEAKVMLKNAAQLKGNNFEFVESFEVASKRVVELAGKNVETKNKKESCG